MVLAVGAVLNSVPVLALPPTYVFSPVPVWDNGTGQTWPGWTWGTVSSYGAIGWRPTTEYRILSGDYYPRVTPKTDYNNLSTITINAAHRSPPKTDNGVLSVKVTSHTYTPSVWGIFDNNFGTQGKADANTDRMDLYIRLVGDYNTASGSSVNTGMEFGTYLCRPGGGTGGENCPHEANGSGCVSHAYHQYPINSGAWIHLQLNRHPEHLRGISGTPSNNYCSACSMNYFQNMNIMYIETFQYQEAAGTLEMLIDEVRLSQSTQAENEISIGSLWVGYWSSTRKWQIAWTDPSFGTYNDSTGSTFEVRWSTSPITNANYSSAKIITPEYYKYGTNYVRRPNNWVLHAWTQFSLPVRAATNLNKIYFAIKDVSATANGDGHNAPSSNIRTIDYPGFVATQKIPSPPMILPIQ